MNFRELPIYKDTLNVGLTVSEYADLPNISVLSVCDKPALWLKPGKIEIHNFAIAHALGHVLLHPDGVYRDDTFFGDSFEDEANNYALQRLIPLKQIEFPAIALNCDVRRLSTFFCVPEWAMRIQMRKFYGM